MSDTRTAFDVGAAASRLEALLGPGSVTSSGLDRWHVDGITPGLAVRPQDAAQVGDVLRVCGELGAAVIPAGGAQHLCVGNPPRAADVVLLTERFGGVVDHDASNLTITVGAGMPLDAVGAELAKAGQCLPLDPPLEEAATAGGVAAVALSGYRRMQYGGVRDQVIGMRAVTGDGTAIRWGGKTVKNVAGYDMARLFIASLGTLGIFTELTFKVVPLPEASTTLALWSRTAEPLAVVRERLLASPLQPSAVTLVRGAVLPDRRDAGLLVRAEGIEAAVARHRRDLESWAAAAGSSSIEVEVLAGAAEQDLWRGVRDLGWTGDDVAALLSVPPARLPDTMAELTASLPAARLAGHAATGTIWAAAAAGEMSDSTLDAWRAVAARHAGALLLARAPVALKRGDVWSPHPTPRALDLTRDLKRVFDPHGILNPGRFIDGV